MQYMLDTINKKDIILAVGCMPIAGVTSNPTIIKKEGKIDFFPYFRELREIIGSERSLHVQVTAPDPDGMMREAEAVLEKIDAEVFLKVPVNEAGLTAIRRMKKAGYNVTATAISSKAQAYMAIEEGADYLAMYYNRMANMDIDPDEVFSVVADMIDTYGYDSQILGASFKNIAQVNRVFENGAHAATVDPAILFDALRLPAIRSNISAFAADWADLYGDRTIADL